MWNDIFKRFKDVEFQPRCCPKGLCWCWNAWSISMPRHLLIPARWNSPPRLVGNLTVQQEGMYWKEYMHLREDGTRNKTDSWSHCARRLIQYVKTVLPSISRNRLLNSGHIPPLPLYTKALLFPANILPFTLNFLPFLFLSFPWFSPPFHRSRSTQNLCYSFIIPLLFLRNSIITPQSYNYQPNTTP